MLNLTFAGEILLILGIFPPFLLAFSHGFHTRHPPRSVNPRSLPLSRCESCCTPAIHTWWRPENGSQATSTEVSAERDHTLWSTNCPITVPLNYGKSPHHVAMWQFHDFQKGESTISMASWKMAKCLFTGNPYYDPNLSGIIRSL